MDPEWLTYAEASLRLGIKIDSVKRRARARHWARRTTNTGLVQVAVPADVLPDNSPDSRADGPPAVPPKDPLLSSLDPYLVEAATQRARADALAEQVADLKIERDRLLNIIESYGLRSVDTRPSMFDRIERLFKRR